MPPHGFKTHIKYWYTSVKPQIKLCVAHAHDSWIFKILTTVFPTAMSDVCHIIHYITHWPFSPSVHQNFRRRFQEISVNLLSVLQICSFPCVPTKNTYEIFIFLWPVTHTFKITTEIWSKQNSKYWSGDFS